MGISDTSLSYALSSNGSTAPSTGWSTTVPTLTKGNYLWTRTVWTYSNATTETGYSVSYVAKDGNDGEDGIAGKDGVGISNTVIEYVGAVSGTSKPTSGWSTTIPTVPAGQYLWTRTTWQYTDGTSEQGFTNALMGRTGASGKDGVAGKDGVGIKSTQIMYAQSTSGTTAPTTGWTAQVPTLIKGQYLWTQTTWVYTDNTGESGYTVSYNAKDGNNGTDGIAGKDGVGIANTLIQYVGSTSGTTKPTSGWSTTIPTVAEGNYLWTKTTWTYTDNTSEVGYSVAKMGDKGTGIQTINNYYLASSANSGITVSSTGWTTTPQTTTTTNKYLWNYEEVVLTSGSKETTTPSIIGVHGETGKGISTVTNYYLASASSTGITTGTSGWSTSIQTTTVTNKYLWNYEKITYTDATTQNTTPVIIGTYSADGVGIVSISEKYAVSASATTPPTTWQDTAPSMTATNRYLWNYEISTLSNGTTSETKKRVIGAYGNTGNDGVSFTGITSYYLVSANSTGITTATSGWSTTPPITTTTNKYLWNYDKINYSDGTSTNSTPMIIGTHGATGNSGTDATAYWVTPSVNVIKKSASGTLSPTTILFSGYAKTGTANTVSYAGRFIISTSTDGITYTNVYTSASNQSTYTYTIPTTVKFIKVRMYLAGGTSVLLDEQTIPVLESAEDLEIGGRNYITDTARVRSTNGNGGTNQTQASTSFYFSLPLKDFAKVGDTFTFSATAEISGSGFAGRFFPQTAFNAWVSLTPVINVTKAETININRTLTITQEMLDVPITMIRIRCDNVPATVKIDFTKVMLSKGNKALDWVPALEDAKLYTAWSNDPNGKDMVRVYPNENMILNAEVIPTVFYRPITGATTSITSALQSDGWHRISLRTSGVNNQTEILPTPNRWYTLKSGVTYTQSILVKTDATYNSSLINEFSWFTNEYSHNRQNAKTEYLGNNIYRISGTLTPTKEMNLRLFDLYLTAFQYHTTGTYMDFKYGKLEIGSEATAWTSNPTEDPVKAEMAYIGYSPKDSNSPSDYVWSDNPKAKGTFKRWSNDTNGIVDFTRTYPSENLITNSKTLTDYSASVWTRKATDIEGFYMLDISTTNNTSWQESRVLLSPEYGSLTGQVTVSFEYKNSVRDLLWTNIGAYNGDSRLKEIDNVSVDNNPVYVCTVLPNGWTKAVGVFDVSNLANVSANAYWLQFKKVSSKSGDISVRKVKVEKGSNPNAIYTSSAEEDSLLAIPQYVGIGSKDTMNPADFVWTVSPEYTQARTDLGLDEKADQKDLDDVRDTADHANNLGENAVQQNEFYSWLEDDYAKQIDEMKSISEQSQADLQNIDGRTALIESNLGNMSEKWNFIDTSITMAEEGILISDKADKMSILVSSGRIVFFDNEVEVAYITSQMLNISRGVFLESATIGNHVITKYSNTSPVTIIRYVGDVI